MCLNNVLKKYETKTHFKEYLIICNSTFRLEIIDNTKRYLYSTMSLSFFIIYTVITLTELEIPISYASTRIFITCYWNEDVTYYFIHKHIKDRVPI